MIRHNSPMIPLLSDSPEGSKRIRRKNSIHISLDDFACAQGQYNKDGRAHMVLTEGKVQRCGQRDCEHRLIARSPGHGSPSAAHCLPAHVSPFENFSEDKAFAFFADGVHDEILSQLQPALRLSAMISQYFMRSGFCRFCSSTFCPYLWDAYEKSRKRQT
jgi:hypothetical protein